MKIEGKARPSNMLLVRHRFGCTVSPGKALWGRLFGVRAVTLKDVGQCVIPWWFWGKYPFFPFTWICCNSLWFLNFLSGCLLYDFICPPTGQVGGPGESTTIPLTSYLVDTKQLFLYALKKRIFCETHWNLLKCWNCNFNIYVWIFVLWLLLHFLQNKICFYDKWYVVRTPI